MQTAPEAVVAEARRIAAALGCRRAVRICTSPRFSVPFLCGFMRPVVVLPGSDVRKCILSAVAGGSGARAGPCAIVRYAVEHAYASGFDSALVSSAGMADRIGPSVRVRCGLRRCFGVVFGRRQRVLPDACAVALDAAQPTALAGLAMARNADVRRRLAMLQSRVFALPLRRRVVVPAGIIAISVLALVAGLKFALAEVQSSKEKAAELMRSMYDGVAWLDSAKSFYIVSEDKTSPSDLEVHWCDKHPMGGYGMSGKIDPRPYCVNTELAWDETRNRYRTKAHHEGDSDIYEFTKVWDGSLAVEYSHGESDGHKQYVLGNKIKPFFNERKMVVAVPWQPEGKHRLALEDFNLEGQETINGRPCYVLLSRAGHYRMYVGIADKRLYRSIQYVARDGKAGYDRLALCQKIGGPTIKSLAHWDAWVNGLPPEKQKEISRQVAIADFEFAGPLLIRTWDDYREAAPGCWMPFRETIDSYNLEVPDSFLSLHTERTVKEATVDKSLDDALFHIDLEDGVNVATDWRYDPIIRYTYRKDQTEAERVALCEAERAKQSEGAAEMKKRQAVIEGRLGQAPPPLPRSGWINSEPLSWDKLRGKVVLLHFWEVNCGPCWNELPILARWHDNLSKNDDIVIIGIHPPTDDVDAVRKKLDQFQVRYPVLIDAKPTKSGGLGTMHDWFGNPWWPHVVLVNKQGLTAGHGGLLMGDVDEQMKKLEVEEMPPKASEDKAPEKP